MGRLSHIITHKCNPSFIYMCKVDRAGILASPESGIQAMKGAYYEKTDAA